MKRAVLCGLVLAFASAAHADGAADPMRPPVVDGRGGEPREAAPVLSAVLTFNGVHSAIFNGHLVHEGATVGNYTIEAVLVDGVRVRRGGVVQELRLPRLASSIKKPAIESDRVASGAK
jgi:hypothetical protein